MKSSFILYLCLTLTVWIDAINRHKVEDTATFTKDPTEDKLIDSYRYIHIHTALPEVNTHEVIDIIPEQLRQ